MVFSDVDIRNAIEREEIKINPFEKRNIQPASLDLRLGDNFLSLDYHKSSGVIKLNEKLDYEKRKGVIILPPGEFILGTTLEYISLPRNIVANVQGRSSIGRIGLFIQNAGWIDPGFEGNITLELFNANKLPIELVPNRRICQLIFDYTTSPSQNPYNGKYNGQIEATGSKIYEDEDQ